MKTQYSLGNNLNNYSKKFKEYIRRLEKEKILAKEI